MYLKKKLPKMVIALMAVGLLVSCSDFLTDPELQRDPNRAVNTSADQLFNGIQVATFFANEGQINRTTSIWMQQMAGVDRQFATIGRYVHSETDHAEEYENAYTGGGLIDIKALIQKTTENNWIAYRGIAKFYEAFRIGMSASIFGDVAYSQAASDEFDTPDFDEQADVYAAVQSLLDEAIEDLGGDADYLPPNDLAFGADLGKWMRACYSLKARFYLHWAEVDPGNYQAALMAAQNGMASIDDNYASVHSTALYEGNMWSQFDQYRSGYVMAGSHLVDLLKARNDPRLELYFAEDANGEFRGSHPDDPDPTVSNLSETFLDPANSTDILTWEETQLIIAECAFHTGDEGLALAKLNEVRRGIEIRFGFDPDILGVASGLSGEALIDAIMEEKYIAMFLNMEVYNDWKRTNRPVLQTYAGQQIPRRLYYSNDERQTNPNVPIPAQQPLRNDNDPGDDY